MNPNADDSKAEAAPSRRIATLVLAWAEILLGCGALGWAFTDGIRRSSLGVVLVLWGSVATLFGMVLPGLLLLPRAKAFWYGQLGPVVLLAFVAFALALRWFGASPR